MSYIIAARHEPAVGYFWNSTDGKWGAEREATHYVRLAQAGDAVGALMHEYPVSDRPYIVTREGAPPSAEPSDVERLTRLVEEATRTCATTTELVAALKDERARLQAGLSFTPRQALEALRTHARKCVERGQEIVFQEGGNAIHAEPYPDKGYPDPPKNWKVFVGHSSCESCWSEASLLEHISRATMFEANVS